MISPSHLTAPGLNTFPMGENEDVDISKSLWILAALNTDFPQQTVQVTLGASVSIFFTKKYPLWVLFFVTILLIYPSRKRCTRLDSTKTAVHIALKKQGEGSCAAQQLCCMGGGGKLS